MPAAAFVGVGIFVGFPLGALLREGAWIFPGDVWKSFQGGRFFAWGDFPDALHFVSAPGTAVLLAPPAWLATRLHLVAAFPFYVAHPSAWLVLDPYVLVISSSIVFAVDRLAGRLGVVGAGRVLLLWASVIFALPVVSWWGHPEDVVALAIALAATGQGIGGRWGRAGWLFGAAAVLQPLTLLLLPPVLALTVPRQWARVVWRLPVLTVLVLLVPVVVDGGNLDRFFHEPNDIWPNFPTPVLWISPHPGHNLVSAAPARGAALLLALAVGWWAWRRRVTPVQAMWCGAAAMAVRFLVEPVTLPYYLWPAAALLLVVMAARATWWALAPLAAASTYAYFHRETWLYWLPLVGMVGLALVVTYRAAFREGAAAPAWQRPSVATEAPAPAVPSAQAVPAVPSAPAVPPVPSPPAPAPAEVLP